MTTTSECAPSLWPPQPWGRPLFFIHIGRRPTPPAVADYGQLLREIMERLQIMSDQLTALQAAVAAEDTVIDSAIALINGIAAEIASAGEAGADGPALQALADDITAKADALSAAVAANTPAA